MPTRGNIVVNDRAPTPVAHTFSPEGEDANGVHSFIESNGVPANAPRFTIGWRKSGGKYRPSIRLAVPVAQTQTINGVSSSVVVRTAYIDCNFTFDETSLLQERKDAVGMFANALAASQTMIDGVITGLQDIYG